jgi:hypothetical protein
MSKVVVPTGMHEIPYLPEACPEDDPEQSVFRVGDVRKRNASRTANLCDLANPIALGLSAKASWSTNDGLSLTIFR